MDRSAQDVRGGDDLPDNVRCEEDVEGDVQTAQRRYDRLGLVMLSLTRLISLLLV